MKINETLKKLRQSKNLTQSDMAANLDVSLSSYQKYERDKNSVIPSLDVLLKIADFYDVTTDYLLGRDTGEPEPLDQLKQQFNMTAFEKKILKGYLELPENMRDNLMDFLERSVQEVLDESDESEGEA